MDITEIEFYKYQGTADDFIVIDNRDGRYSDLLSNESFVRRMCLRYFGVDSYGIVEVKRNKEYGLEYVMHRTSGVISNMCGNGCRVFASFVKISGIHTGIDDVTFLAGDGVHYGNYDAAKREGWASIKDVSEAAIHISKKEYIVNTGLPHLVAFVDFDVRQMVDLQSQAETLGKKRKQFGTENCDVIVNYVYEDEGNVHARCYNTNIGREDISCGTGTAAIGVSYALKSGCKVPSDFEAKIQWPGGQMKCLLHRDTTTFSKIRISGPVRQVFKGTFYVDSMQ